VLETRVDAMSSLLDRVATPATSESSSVLHRRFNVNAVLAFWIAYILTRPLGASIGDYLSRARAMVGSDSARP
jgi:Repeat of Unknown Function (DUF347)